MNSIDEYDQLNNEYACLIWFAPRGEEAIKVWVEELREVKSKLKEVRKKLVELCQ